MSIIEFDHIDMVYSNGQQSLSNLSLEINQGELITILGPSGCGKTTLIKMVNGLLYPTKGKVLLKGKDISLWDPIELRRSIGYVIQQIGLFPHLTIQQNIAYVLMLMGRTKEFQIARAIELIDLVGLEKKYLSRYPHELSGGQCQRIGVARAFAADPEIIIMDEPFGAVDEIARSLLQEELIAIHRKLKKTILFVTHDIEEALRLGTKIVLLNNGKIEQVGSKEEMVLAPRNEFVKDFFGLKGLKALLDKKSIYKIFKLPL